MALQPLITWLVGVHVLIMNELRTFLLLTEQFAGIVTTPLHQLYIYFFVSYPVTSTEPLECCGHSAGQGTHRQQRVVPALHAPRWACGEDEIID